MATTPPPTAPSLPPSGGGGGNKILLGCGLGCGAIVLLLVIGLGVLYVKVGKPMAEAMTRAKEVQEQNGATTEAIAALDSTFPSAVGEDVGSADLTASQLESYIALRSSLGSQAGAVAAARDELASSIDMSGLSAGGLKAAMAGVDMMTGMVRGAIDLELARGELLKAAVAEMEAEGVGPTELRRVMEIVEWRFLRNEAALPVALSPSERSDWLTKQWEVGFTRSLLDATGAKMGSADRAKLERQLEVATERLADLRALAEERVELSEATRALLESRRAELHDLPTAGVLEFSMLDENANPLEGMQGSGGAPFSP